MTLIKSPDSGCVYLPVCGELPEVNVVPSRATTWVIMRVTIVSWSARVETQWIATGT
jgi:hypothetical protein